MDVLDSFRLVQNMWWTHDFLTEQKIYMNHVYTFEVSNGQAYSWLAAGYIIDNVAISHMDALN